MLKVCKAEHAYDSIKRCWWRYLHAIAQGSVSIGGKNEGTGNNMTDHPTVAVVSQGALVEKEFYMTYIIKTCGILAWNYKFQ